MDAVHIQVQQNGHDDQDDALKDENVRCKDEGERIEREIGKYTSTQTHTFTHIEDTHGCEWYACVAYLEKDRNRCEKRREYIDHVRLMECVGVGSCWR